LILSLLISSLSPLIFDPPFLHFLSPPPPIERGEEKEKKGKKRKEEENALTPSQLQASTKRKKAKSR